MTLLSLRGVRGSISGSVKSDAVSSPLRCFFGAVLFTAQALSLGNVLAARYTLRCNISSIIKI